MAFEKGVMEIADSDEEPVTSSPSAAPADAADKLHAMASAPPQEPQDAAQDAHCAHQALGQADANTTGQSTAGLGLSRDDASIDLDTSSADHTDVKPDGALLPQEEGAMSVLMSQDFAPRTLDASVANSSTGQLASSAAPALCDTLAREYACPKLAEDVVDTYQPQAHELQTRTVQDHVVADGSSQSRLKDGVQEAGQDAGTIHPSENAVHRSQAMGISDTTRISAAVPNSSNPASPAFTEAASPSAPPKDTADAHPRPDPSVIQDQKLQMNPGDCRPNVTSQEAAISARETSPFSPQVQTLQEKPKVRSLALQEPPQPKEPASHDLNASDAPLKPACEPQHQSTTGASPTATRTGLSKTRQEITLSELKTQKAALLASLRSLPGIQVLIEEMASSHVGVDDGHDEPTDKDVMTAANKIVKEHIKLLHEYNELKDAGQGLMGLIADQRGVRIVEVQQEFGIDADD